MPQKAPNVSVVLPFYNAEKTLSRSLQSIAEQDFIDFECIMVNNNSSDGSREIAAEWEGLDPRFRLIDEKRQGVMFASNRGCEFARGAFIARMDADDVALPGRLRLQGAFLDSHPDYGAVAGLANHVGDPETSGGFRRFVEWSNSLVTYKEIYNRRFIEAPIVNPTAMWRRETMEQHGLYLSGDFPEDYEMWLRWLDKGVKIAKVPEVVLDWHDSDGRLTRTHPIYSDRAFYEIKSSYLAKFLSEWNPYHPHVSIWGASRISRRRAKILEQHGVRIDTYIDTKKSRQLDRKLIYYEDLPEAGSMFILTYIRQMDNRERIQTFLESRGYIEGANYLLVS
ncbi:MAG: glycosyltransferase family A protein [Bacteroidota bacterium]|nr:glycosyltransferase family A protein [Bacteroidota bacterium]